MKEVFDLGNFTERDYLENQDLNERIILNSMFHVMM
jgi:hypothetical protein